MKLGSWSMLGLVSVAAAAAAVAAEEGWRRNPSRRALASPPAGAAGCAAAARRLDRASALLAASALADSAVEHYRGSFHNKTMYLPLAVATETLAASLTGTADPGSEPQAARDLARGLALVTGVVGTGFHIYNIAKRPGGIGWLNLFYAAPLGAPAALSLSGMLGLLAERIRGGGGVLGAAPGRLVAGLVAIGLLGTSGEAGLLHFRGAFHNPAMLVPVTVPPLAAVLLARAAWSAPGSIAAARWPLRLLIAVGFIGSGFHAYGVGRNMGGWRNWSQNVLNGPPLPAPPAFTALAIAGLAALRLVEGGR